MRMCVMGLLSLMAGCDVGNNVEQNGMVCEGSTINNLISAGNTTTLDVLEGLDFTFANGVVFHGTFVDTAVAMRVDTTTNAQLTVSISANDQTAHGVVPLESCPLFENSRCLITITTTDSEFSIGRGPQAGEILELQNWRLFGRLDKCTNRTTAALLIEDLFGNLVSSEALDLAETRLCPLICPEI